MITKIALGSCRIDKGEDLKYAFAAIERTLAQNPTHYAFDIIYANPKHKLRAIRYHRNIRNRIIERMPNVKLFTGITADEMDRPGGFELLKLVHKEGNLNFVPIDTNPEREKSWNA